MNLAENKKGNKLESWGIMGKPYTYSLLHHLLLFSFNLLPNVNFFWSILSNLLVSLQVPLPRPFWLLQKS